MKYYLLNIVIPFSLLFVATLTLAQEISVTASVDKDKILIGEPVQLKLELALPEDQPVRWFNTDTIPHFEFIEKGIIDSSVKGVYTQVLTITSFDSGINVIPAFSLGLNGNFYLTDSIPVTVSFSPFDPTQDYHDIKDILEVKQGPDYLKWTLLAAGILLFLTLIWYLLKKYRRKPLVKEEGVSHLKALEEALLALEELQKQGLPEKQYYTRLNDIIRWFVYRKTRIATMQKTNEEFILQLEKLGLPQEDFISLAQTLRMADAVKFAKFIPTEQEQTQSFRIVRQSIEQINNYNNRAV